MNRNHNSEPNSDRISEERPDGAREFRFWDLNDVTFTNTIGLFGQRGVGKTTCISNILEAKRLPRGIVMCPTPEAFCTYSTSIPLAFIYDYFDEAIIVKICGFQNGLKLRLEHQYRQEMAQLEANAAIDRKNKWMQRMQTLKQRQIDENLSARQIQILYEREILEEEFEEQQNLEMRKSYARTRKMQLQEPYSMFCVLDDLSSDRETMKSQVLKKLMDNGRHYLMLLIIACQYSMDFPASCRGGLDWIILWYDSLSQNVKRLYDYYVGEFADRHVFTQALAECARRNCCLVIKKRSKSPDVYDSVFLYQPKEVWMSTKMLGDPQFEWVHNMFFSEKKFLANQNSGGGAMATKTDDKKKDKKAAKPTSKSFSIESIEKKHGPGRRGGMGKSDAGHSGGLRGIGGSGAKGKKNLAAGAGPYQPPPSSNSWDEEEDFDPEEDRRKQEQKQVNQNLKMLRQKLRQQAHTHAKALQNQPSHSEQNQVQQIESPASTPQQYSGWPTADAASRSPKVHWEQQPQTNTFSPDPSTS